MKTAILLGAGSSIPAGFPSTQRLTDLVLSGDVVKRHTDGSYYRSSEGEVPASGAEILVTSMVQRLYDEAERYFDAGGDRPNYEDLFYLAKQASDERGEAENPAIRSFVDKLRSDMAPLIAGAQADGASNTFFDFLDETCNYVADIVWRSLAREPSGTDHLEILAEGCRRCQIVGISTLCHDTHVEKFLAERDVPFADGFSKPEAGVRYWHGTFPSGTVAFLKLHGSVDWFRLRAPVPAGSQGDEGFFHERIGIALHADPDHTRTMDGSLQDNVGIRPMLLVGTFNKTSEYARGMFRDVHYRFRTMLREANQLVVCGYGFGDKGINSEVIDWYYAKKGRRFVVIHPQPSELLSNARGAVGNKWNDWKLRGSVKLIAKRLECVSADEFMDALRCPA